MLRLGVIGYGDSGNDFIKAAQYAPTWEAVAVGGRNPEKAGAVAAKHGIAVRPEEELVTSDDIDVVAISTPPGLHREGACRALEHGKHVIVEKPMALTLEDCDRMIRCARVQGRYLMVSQSMRFFPGSVKAKELIDQGTIGQVIMVQEHWYYNYFGSKRTGWQVDPRLSGGGVVMNPVVHMTDRIRFMWDAEVATVDAVIGYHHPDLPQIEGNVQAFFRMANGGPASILLHGYNAMRGSICCTVFGTKGIITIPSWAISCWLHQDGQRTEIMGETHMQRFNDPVNVSYLAHLLVWEEQIREGRPVSSPGENGRANVAVSLAILEASRTGQPVHLNQA